MSPMQFVKNKSISPYDYNRIVNADLRYLIIITKNYKVIDGMHRLTKSISKRKEMLGNLLIGIYFIIVFVLF